MQPSYSRAVALILQPWLAAKLVFKPGVRPLREDRILDRLAFWRATVGLATIVVIGYQYQGIFHPGVNSFWKMVQTGAIALLLPPLSLLLMLVITRAGHRAQLLPGARRLLVRAAPALAVICLPFFLLSLNPNLSNNGDAEGAGILVLLIALPFLLLWYCCFWGCTIYWAARTGMWTGEINPLLAPIGSTLIMLLLNVSELITGDSNGLPHWIWLTLNLCGTVTSLLLSFAEYRRLRSIGYRFRGGPVPVTRSATEPMTHGEPEPAH
ncbi:hypothetical protein [Nonomuraea glycinis]|uniref:hypothetical protein n=1 Tax=Nonomuraea glycinis TaxID=2047744 RepID=UPI0033BB1152